MMLPSILQVISFLCLTTTTVLAISLSKPGCPEKCGNITIPYPFGLGTKCSANYSFTVTCQNSTPFLNSIKMGVVNISLFGTVIVSQSVSPTKCSDGTRTKSLPISLKGSPFTISAHYNALAVLGCKNSVWLHANKTTVGGCMAICDANSTDTSCNGVNCCQTTIPARLQELQYTYQSIQASNSSFCGYVFPVDKKWLQKEHYKSYKGLISDLPNPFDREFRIAPLVLEWEFVDMENYFSFVGMHCTSPSNYIVYGESYYGFDSSSYNNYYLSMADEYISSIGYCSCNFGRDGNPYVPGGCPFKACMNPFGCTPDDNNRTRQSIKLASIFIGSILGSLIFLITTWKFTKVVTRINKARRKYMFYKRNGGLLLEQHLSATENCLEKTKLFSSNELAKATDHYNENRVLGRGGQGTVYKGMLVDGRIVAVKKSKKLEEGDIEVFINEVVILSQINHRNVVKLLGCCLETEVPRLVYEFIPNGTLFQHIHDPNEEIPLTWKIRVRISREVAGALAYLHSTASTPIYHRDVKSTNILLDDKYQAKIADFGTSRSVSIDQTHLTTRVVGTFGYLDPEYFRSGQFSEKSDVYSFGVVMVELLTGEKAISSIRVEEERGLAMHFLHSMEENQLFDILDARVLEEDKKEEIMVIAELARRCLQLNGKARPTMKEVARELEGIQTQNEGSNFPQNRDDNIEGYSIDGADDFSSISGSMCFDTISQYSPDTEHPLLDEP